MLFEDALMQEHCKLTELQLNWCLLTDQCISSLCLWHWKMVSVY
jgi:hypothetical protein